MVGGDDLLPYCFTYNERGETMKKLFVIFIMCVIVAISGNVLAQSVDSSTTSQDTTKSTVVNTLWSGFKLTLNFIESRATTAEFVTVYNVRNGMQYGTAYEADGIDFANNKMRFGSHAGYLAPDRGFVGLSLRYKPAVDLKVVQLSNSGIIGDGSFGLTGKCIDGGGGIITNVDKLAGIPIQTIVEKFLFFLK